ncbi:arsenate reductase (glutaredoxin) [Kaarinaea lacus]
MPVTIYHNPRCSKSRNTLRLLADHDIEPEIVEYLETPPDAKTLDTLLTKLGMEPRDLMRKHEAEYKENNLDDESLSRVQLIQAMIDHPRLIERPIVVANNKVAIGRPPENVLEIL